jgi:APA family basic amino acid/polyamine antiporter
MPTLERRLGTGDAVLIGLGSMVGAGIFAAFGPAAAAAGSGLLVGIVVAGFVAWCNATSSAQLAAQYPESGGTYVYGRERLGPWWGFAAGWCFVVGKTASCAAMATTVGSYLLPDSSVGARSVGIVVVVALTAVAARGITRTAQLTRVLVGCSVAVLLLCSLFMLNGGSEHSGVLPGSTPYGVLQAAGLFFFAFAGYARIATMGEEVRDPARVIPRAIVISLALALLLYLLVGAAALHAVGAGALANSRAPLVTAVRAAGPEWAVPLVVVGAVLASVGALLALLNGIGRTGLAMGRRGDLPRRLATVTDGVPRHAQLVVGAVVVLLVATLDLRGIIGFSSFGVLLYYAIANTAAYTQDREHRRWPRWLQVAGVAGCLVLAATLPWQSVVVGVVVLGAGLLGRRVLTAG